MIVRRGAGADARHVGAELAAGTADGVAGRAGAGGAAVHGFTGHGVAVLFRARGEVGVIRRCGRGRGFFACERCQFRDERLVLAAQFPRSAQRGGEGGLREPLWKALLQQADRIF